MKNSRRNFLKKSTLLGLSGITYSFFGKNSLNDFHKNEITSFLIDENKFSLPDLPYLPNALEPFIDKETMLLHHGKHHHAYVDKLNAALKNYKGDLSWKALFSQISKLDSAIRNNGGGHYNHSLFWKLMRANPEGYYNLPEGKLAQAINADFNSFENFKKEFSESALKVFGSGWCWLIKQNEKLKITVTSNQDNPLMDVVPDKGTPILALDVWEHAYYLKHQNKRAGYINNWWNLVNWPVAEILFLTKQ